MYSINLDMHSLAFSLFKNGFTFYSIDLRKQKNPYHSFLFSLFPWLFSRVTYSQNHLHWLMTIPIFVLHNLFLLPLPNATIRLLNFLRVDHGRFCAHAAAATAIPHCHNGQWGKDRAVREKPKPWKQTPSTPPAPTRPCLAAPTIREPPPLPLPPLLPQTMPPQLLLLLPPLLPPATAAADAAAAAATHAPACLCRCGSYCHRSRCNQSSHCCCRCCCQCGCLPPPLPLPLPLQLWLQAHSASRKGKAQATSA